MNGQHPIACALQAEDSATDADVSLLLLLLLRPAAADPCGCIFPFIYKNATYNACTTVDDTHAWCMVSPCCANFPLANNSMPPGMRRA